MEPLISIIIPVYNGENFITDAINSIINQSIGFENLELIVVDDKSTDNTKKILESFVDKYDNFKAVYLETNSGDAGRPRNVGMDNASADYIMFCDADDLYKKDMCETLYNTIKEHDVDFVTSRYNVDYNGEDKGLNYVFLDKYEPIMKIDSIHDFPQVVFSLGNIVIFTKIYKKEYIVNNNLRYRETGRGGEDYYFGLEVYLKSKGFVLLNKYSGYIYRHVNDVSMTSKVSKDRFMDMLESGRLGKEILLENNFNYKGFFSESVIIWVREFLLADLDYDDQVEFLNGLKPYCKDYSLFNRLLNLPIYLNIIINITLKSFLISNTIPIFLSKVFKKPYFRGKFFYLG